jgi:hypothetical protein
MANSITPAGTSRSLFGVASGDIVTGGTVTASSFIGVGKSLTNINANNIITGNIGVARGGTGNNSFITNAIIFNSNNKLVSDNNLSWENNILTINNRDFISDTCNYISSETSRLTDIISYTENILTQQINEDTIETNLNVSNYILSTSNELIEYIKSEQENNIIYPATADTLGSVQIGSGIYVNNNGVISLTPEIIYIIPPEVNNYIPTFTTMPGGNYSVCKFTYNPLIGTTFDRDNLNRRILAVWYNFLDSVNSSNILINNNNNISSNILTINEDGSSNILIINEDGSSNILINNEDGSSNILINNEEIINEDLRKIKNKGYLEYSEELLTSLELHGDINISPSSIYMRDVEYMPLDSTYLELNCVSDIPTFGNFENGFDINSIFRTYSNWGLTIGFWLKVNLYSSEIIIIEFSNADNFNMRKLSINYVNDTLTFYMDKTKTPIITIANIYIGYWYHIIWSIEKQDSGIEVSVYINGIRKEKLIIINEFVSILGFSKYILNTISSQTNTSNYNFCVSDFKIYNTSLQEDEKRELYNLNKFTKYIVDFKDTQTICDIMAYGGGGGGCGSNNNYGGGAGNLVYVNDAYISKGLKTITVGRGGSAYYSNIGSNYQLSSRGNDTSFEDLIAEGGGAVTNHIFDYYIASNIYIASNYTIFLKSRPNEPIYKIFTSNYTIYNTYSSNITSNVIGGCGSGNNGLTSTFNLTNELKTFVGYTNNIYSYANIGGEYGGGGVGSAGGYLNGGEGLYNLNLVNNNTDTDKYFNFNSILNIKNTFNLIDNNIGELKNGEIYIACGGGGSNIISEENSISRNGYNSKNSGSGGNYGENGKHGALLLRFLTKIDRNIVPKFVKETSNYVLASSNNILSYVNNLTSISGALLWRKATNNIYYNLGNVGIGVEPNNYKFEVSSGEGITPEDAEIFYGIHTSNYSNIEVAQNITNTNICAKFNSSIWTTGNVISSSDERIKTNIIDLHDDNALQMILNIQPKTYNYIDLRGRRDGHTIQATPPKPVYGFIAQQIKSVIPDAVRIQTEFIPNIFLVAEYSDNIITLPSNNLNIIIAIDSKIKCYDMRDNIIIVEVVEIISELSFKIKNIQYWDNVIFVYGTEVNDFHALNKEYINTLNVCAVQELHRKIVLQQNEIKGLNDKVNVLLSYIDLSRMKTIEDDINDLKARYDLIVNYIDLHK